jgi:hypothetical protein
MRGDTSPSHKLSTAIPLIAGAMPASGWSAAIVFVRA